MVRFRNRYLSFHVQWKDGRVDADLGESHILGYIREKMHELFGDHGLGSALVSLQVKYYNPVTCICLLRCSRDQYRQIWLAMSMLCQVQNRVCRCRMLHATGTMDKAVEYVRDVEQRILSDSEYAVPSSMMEIGSKKMQMLDAVLGT